MQNTRNQECCKHKDLKQKSDNILQAPANIQASKSPCKTRIQWAEFFFSFSSCKYYWWLASGLSWQVAGELPVVEMGGNEPKPDTKKMSDEMNIKDIY